MFKGSKYSKKFQVGIERFLHRLDPIRSTEIQFDLGEEEPSSWILEFCQGSLGDSRGLTVSLYRNDKLQIDVDAELYLDISDLAIKDSKVFLNVAGTGTEDSQGDTSLVIENFVSEEKLLGTEQFSIGTILIQCELKISCSNLESEHDSLCLESQETPGRKILTFGPVEELHYIKYSSKMKFHTKVAKITRHVFEDFTKKMEKNRNLDRLMHFNR